MEHLQRGTIFEGKYRIQGELGRGGFGMVYRAFQLGMDRDVALKVLNPSMGERAARTAYERFLREVRIISKLRHPNTVTIHDFGETQEGLVYMVLEYVDGEELKSVFKRRGALDEERACRIAIQIAKSLSEAHRHGIIHRDLKPANIMLTEVGGESDFVKVLDFGIARLRGGRTGQRNDLTSVGLPEGERELIGTPRYMSPEQVRGEELTGASDVYSLGLILYEMLTGEPAVQGDTAMALITQQISSEPLRLGNLNRVHPRLQHIIIRAVSKSTQHRYRTVDVLAQELEQASIELRREQYSGGYNSGMHDSSSSNDFLLGNQYDHFQQSGYQSGSYQQTPQPGQQYPSGQYPAPQQPSGQYPSGQYQQPPQQWQGQPQGYGYQSGPMEPVPQFAPYGQQQPMQFGHADENAETQQALEPLSLPQQQDTLSALAPDLPPPVLEEQSPFHVEPEPDEPPQRPRDEEDDGDDLGFAIALSLALLMGLGLIVSLYVLFIIMGAAMELIVKGPIRFIATIIVALIIPTVPLIAEGGGRERFKVVYSKLHKARKALTVGLVLNLGSALLLCFAFPEQIVGELRAAPNWFLGNNTPQQESPLERTNRKVSYELADNIERSMTAAGRYDKKRTAEEAPPPIPSKPEPTRPATRGGEDAAKPPKRTRRMPAPTRPGTKKNGDESEDDSSSTGKLSRDATKQLQQKRDEEKNKRPRKGTSKQGSGDKKRDGDYVEW